MDVRFHELENKACCTRLRMIAAETVSDEGEQDEQDKLAIDRAYLIRKKALEWAFRLYDIKSSDALSEETKLERSENLKKEMVSEIEKAYDPRYLMEKEWEMRKYEIQRSKTLSSETKEEQLKELEEQFQEKLRNISENPKYLIPETRRIHAGDSIRIAERYAVCESDRPHRWDIFTPSLRNVRHSEELTVKNFIPDYIEYEQTPVYDDKENLVAEGTLSVVRISTGKPSITQKAAKTNLKLFTLVQYGKMILRERLKDGHKIRVEGCIYFLQKKNDSNGENPTFDEDFFKETNGLNIVRQSDDYEADGGRTPHEQEMDEIIHGFVEGMDPEAVGKSECEKCKYFYVCNYEKAPVPFTKVAEEKKIDIKKFSKEQKAAVNFQKGIMLINAGAGTGKTAVMSMAPVVLLKQGVIPESLFMSTFSRSGMEETGPRVQYNLRQHGLGDDYDRIRIQTLHSFGYECIKKVWKKLGFSEEPAVADEVEKNDLIASLLANNVIPGLDYRNPEINFKNSMGAITVISKTFEIIKRGEKGMSFTKKDIDTVWKKLGKVRRYIKADKSVLNQVFDLYDIFQKELRERNLVEYSDMEILLVEYLKQDPHFLDQFKFRHILIDEFQDSSGAQVELLKALCKCPTFESLRVVGDDWQSVGAFRGVTPEYMINFEKIMAEEGFNVQVVKLERNYRCRPEILKAAMKMISKNKNRLKKVLKAVRKSCGLDVVVKGFYSVNEEREFIRNDIKKHLDD